MRNIRRLKPVAASAPTRTSTPKQRQRRRGCKGKALSFIGTDTLLHIWIKCLKAKDMFSSDLHTLEEEIHFTVWICSSVMVLMSGVSESRERKDKQPPGAMTSDLCDDRGTSFHHGGDRQLAGNMKHHETPEWECLTEAVGHTGSIRFLKTMFLREK